MKIDIGSPSENYKVSVSLNEQEYIVIGKILKFYSSDNSLSLAHLTESEKNTFYKIINQF